MLNVVLRGKGPQHGVSHWRIHSCLFAGPIYYCQPNNDIKYKSTTYALSHTAAAVWEFIVYIPYEFLHWYGVSLLVGSAPIHADCGWFYLILPSANSNSNKKNGFWPYQSTVLGDFSSSGVVRLARLVMSSSSYIFVSMHNCLMYALLVLPIMNHSFRICVETSVHKRSIP